MSYVTHTVATTQPQQPTQQTILKAKHATTAAAQARAYCYIVERWCSYGKREIRYKQHEDRFITQINVPQVLAGWYYVPFEF